jgi:phosphoesterase RecJ-like protein
MISLTKEEQSKFNCKKGDTEGFVNILLSIKGIVFAAIFREEKDVIRVSLRSEGNFAVNDVTQKYYNGGGHLNAAGGESKHSMDETIRSFESILPLYKDELNKE